MKDALASCDQIDRSIVNGIVILTATLNHPVHLKELRDSLARQTALNFTWVVVDDGSDARCSALNKKIVEDAVFSTEYIWKNNGGKGSALNEGFNCSEGSDFILIVDDDEVLDSDALEIVETYIERYRNTDCCVIHFNRRDKRGNVIASPVINEDYFLSYQAFKSLGRHADGYIGYFTSRLGETRFIVFPGERYIGPSTLFMQVSLGIGILWAQASLGETEYLDGGITKQGRRLRVQNPEGSELYCALMQLEGAGLFIRFKYSVMGYAYRFLKEGRRNCFFSSSKSGRGFLPICAPIGWILSKVWSYKYLLGNGAS